MDAAQIKAFVALQRMDDGAWRGDLGVLPFPGYAAGRCILVKG